MWVLGLMCVALLSGGLAQALPSRGTDAIASRIVVLPDDTPVELMAMTEVSTATAKPGTVIKLRVNRAVEIDGKIVIPVGTPAFGEVTEAKSSSGLGKTGSMRAHLVKIRLGDADIPIEGDANAKGTSSGSTGVTFLMAGVVGLFNRGNNAKIKAGETLVGFVSEDVTLDLLPRPRRIAAATVATATP